MIHCKNLFKSYKTSEFEEIILNNINLEIKDGSSVSISGKSGSGKSTLFHIMSGLEKFTSGDVLIDGKNVKNLNDKDMSAFRKDHIGYIYQFHHLLYEFSVIENVMMPLHIKGMNKDLAYEASIEILKRVALEKRLDFNINKLSGGERQRVAIARALVGSPKYIFADEPTGNLDKKNALIVFSIMKELVVENNSTFLLATHDSEISNKMSHKYLLENGEMKAI